MMKLIGPILAALVCASTEAEAQLIWKVSAAPPATAQWPSEEDLRREFDSLWASWAKDVGARPAMSSFRIEIRELMGSREVYAARSTWELGRGRIELLPSLPWRAGLRHELGHLFLREWRARHCSPSAAQATPAWLDEIESLIWSEDEASLRERSAEVPSLSRARQHLTNVWPEGEQFLASPHDPQWVAAVSRLLLGPPNLQVQLRDQLLDFGYEDSLGVRPSSHSEREKNNCGSVSERAQKWRRALLSPDPQEASISSNSLKSQNRPSIMDSTSVAQSTAGGELEFALMDLWSGQLLDDSGASAQVRRPVASVLKPLLMVAHAEAWPPIKSQATSEWACPQIQAPRTWNWPEALAKSCNGYFLAQARPLPLDLLAELSWLASEDQERPLSVPESIGLIPRVRADLASVLGVYRALALHHAHLREELRETARSGTLSGLAESAKFVERGWGLKSGTTRNLGGAPDVGWIVGISDSALFAVRRRGTRPQALARELEKLWQRWSEQSLLPSAQPIETQLLALVDERRIEMRCAGPWSIRRASTVQRYTPDEVFRPIQLEAGESALCWRGDWKATLTDAKTAGVRHREVRGLVIKFKPSLSGADAQASPMMVSKPVTAQQRRARRGTHLGLITSRESYVAESLAAELASGPREAQLALARVLAHNLLRGQQRAPRHEVYRLCDSTHCQVFGTSEPTRSHRQIAAQALRDAPLPWSGWLEFSRGGEDAWTQSVAPSVWAKAWPEALQLEQLRFERLGDRAILRSASRIAETTTSARAQAGSRVAAETSCEKLRSALRLRRCPDEVQWSMEERAFIVRGRGEGHDRGLSVEEALHWAREGRSADEILKLSYEPRTN